MISASFIKYSNMNGYKAYAKPFSLISSIHCLHSVLLPFHICGIQPEVIHVGCVLTHMKHSVGV